jgi:hypothetical protein
MRNDVALVEMKGPIFEAMMFEGLYCSRDTPSTNYRILLVHAQYIHWEMVAMQESGGARGNLCDREMGCSNWALSGLGVHHIEENLQDYPLWMNAESGWIFGCSS